MQQAHRSQRADISQGRPRLRRLAADRAGLEWGQPFRLVDQRRTFEQILLQVEEAIVDGRLQPGDRLPPERDLAQAFGVSRASVREALRVLEKFGVMVARRGTGSAAGSVVTEGQSGLQSAIRLHAGLMRIPVGDLVEVRAMLERIAAEKAATRTGGGRADRLTEIVDAMRRTTGFDEFNELDAEFHVQLARASGNALLPVLMQALRGAMRRELLEAIDRRPDWRTERDRLVAEHERVITCIKASDPAAAGSAAHNHVMRFAPRH
jgi:GntR family transcriptional regulator, transcriptional repressor for pyruvate dehydrogenase complex